MSFDNNNLFLDSRQQQYQQYILILDNFLIVTVVLYILLYRLIVEVMFDPDRNFVIRPCRVQCERLTQTGISCKTLLGTDQTNDPNWALLQVLDGYKYS